MNLWRSLKNQKQYRCVQQWTFEILWISIQSYTLSGKVYVNDMRRMQLSVCRTNGIIQWVLCTESTFFLILHIHHALSLSVALHICFHQNNRRMLWLTTYTVVKMAECNLNYKSDSMVNTIYDSPWMTL
jgi:hypothetical protein